MSDKREINELTTVPECPVCHEALPADGDVLTCTLCRTPHHEDCWQYAKGCSAFGCGHVSYEKGPLRDLRIRDVSQLPVLYRPLFDVSCLGAVVLCILGTLGFFLVFAAIGQVSIFATLCPFMILAFLYSQTMSVLVGYLIRLDPATGDLTQQLHLFTRSFDFLKQRYLRREDIFEICVVPAPEHAFARSFSGSKIVANTRSGKQVTLARRPGGKLLDAVFEDQARQYATALGVTDTKMAMLPLQEGGAADQTVHSKVPAVSRPRVAPALPADPSSLQWAMPFSSATFVLSVFSRGLIYSGYVALFLSYFVDNGTVLFFPALASLIVGCISSATVFRLGRHHASVASTAPALDRELSLLVLSLRREQGWLQGRDVEALLCIRAKDKSNHIDRVMAKRRDGSWRLLQMSQALDRSSVDPLQLTETLACHLNCPAFYTEDIAGLNDYRLEKAWLGSVSRPAEGEKLLESSLARIESEAKKAAPIANDAVCAACATALSRASADKSGRGQTVACLACQTLLHEACWLEHGACPSCGRYLAFASNDPFRRADDPFLSPDPVGVRRAVYRPLLGGIVNLASIGLVPFLGMGMVPVGFVLTLLSCLPVDCKYVYVFSPADRTVYRQRLRCQEPISELEIADFTLEDIESVVLEHHIGRAGPTKDDINVQLRDGRTVPVYSSPPIFGQRQFVSVMAEKIARLADTTVTVVNKGVGAPKNLVEGKAKPLEIGE